MMERLDNAAVQAAFQAALDHAMHDETVYGTSAESRVWGNHLEEYNPLDYLHLCQNDVDLFLLPQEYQPFSLISGTSSDFSNQRPQEHSYSSHNANANLDVGLMNLSILRTAGQFTSNLRFPMIPFMDIELLEYSGSLAATDLMTASCNPIWPSELNPQKYPEQQSGYLGVAISDSSESPAAIEFVMHDPMASERAKQRTKTTKSEPKTPSNEQSNEHWDMLKETHLRRLYMEEGHTVNEVIFEMLVIHGHELGKPTLERNFRLWGFSKNRSKRKDLQNSVGRRRRIAYALPATASTIKHLKFASMNEARRRLDRQRPHFGLATTYVQQEKMFHAVDHLVKGLFASGKRSWKAVNPRSTNFTSSNFGFCKTSLDWQLVSEKCRCIAILSDAAQYGETFGVLEDVVDILRSSTRLCNPGFLVYFWKISLTLMNVRIGDRKHFLLFRSFLLQLQEILPSSVGVHHPITDFVISLVAVATSTPFDLKTTLSLACWKAIHVIASILGQEHAIVLNMTAYCVRNWRSRFNPSEENIESGYYHLGASSSISTQIVSEDDISLHFDHLLATLKPMNNAASVIQEAVDIWTITKDGCCKKPRVGNAYEVLSLHAFTFTTELLASHYMEAQGPDRLSSFETGYEYLSKGIATLANGSKEHQTHAMALSKRLESYLKASNDRGRAMKERERGTELRLRIKKMLMTSSWASHQVPGDRPKTGAAWARKSRQSRRESHKRLTLLLDNKRVDTM